MNTDLSVAPEIARLAAPFVSAPPETAAAHTDGRIAADLADLAATPQRWWDLVRFDREGPLRIPVPGTPSGWLLVLPPGSAAECDCRAVAALAGEATETAGETTVATATETAGRARAPRPLRPGRVRLHGTGIAHRHQSVGPGYAVTLHAGVTPLRSG